MKKEKYCICGCGTKLNSKNYMMIALEKPYDNLFFFNDCYERILKEVGGWDGLESYLAKNLELWYNRSEK